MPYSPDFNDEDQVYRGFSNLEEVLEFLMKTDKLAPKHAGLMLRFTLSPGKETPTSVKIVKRLLELGASCNEIMNGKVVGTRMSLLQIAATFNLIESAKVLMTDPKLDLTYRDATYGNTAEEYAREFKNYRMVSLLSKKNVVTSFVQSLFAKKIIRHSQAPLIRRIQSLGYPSHPEGLCHSFSLLGGQAVLVGEAKDFLRRYKYILSIPYSEFKQRYQEAYEKRKNIAIANALARKVAKKEIEGISIENNSQLTQEEEDLLNFAALGEGIEINQTATIPFNKYNFLQRALGIERNTLEHYSYYPGLESRALQEKGGRARLGKTRRSEFNFGEKEKVISFFENIRDLVDQQNEKKQPIEIRLLGFIDVVGPHAITIGYDPNGGKQGAWYFIDANHPEGLKGVHSGNEKELVDLLEEAFRFRFKMKSKVIKFETTLMTTKNEGVPALKSLESNWEKIHKESFKKAIPSGLDVIATLKTSEIIAMSVVSAILFAVASMVVGPLIAASFLTTMAIAVPMFITIYLIPKLIMTAYNKYKDRKNAAEPVDSHEEKRNSATVHQASEKRLDKRKEHEVSIPPRTPANSSLNSNQAFFPNKKTTRKSRDVKFHKTNSKPKSMGS